MCSVRAHCLSVMATVTKGGRVLRTVRSGFANGALPGRARPHTLLIGCDV